jgi:hypothetical protein
MGLPLKGLRLALHRDGINPICFNLACIPRSPLGGKCNRVKAPAFLITSMRVKLSPEVFGWSCRVAKKLKLRLQAPARSPQRISIERYHLSRCEHYPNPIMHALLQAELQPAGRHRRGNTPPVNNGETSAWTQAMGYNYGPKPTP